MLNIIGHYTFTMLRIIFLEHLEINGSESSNTRGKRSPHLGERGCASVDEQCLSEGASEILPSRPSEDLLLKILSFRDPWLRPREDNFNFALETCMKSCSPEAKGSSSLHPFIH